MFDDRTEHHALQLPHPSNQLDEDVMRLRAALVQVDNLLNWATSRLVSDDPTLDTLQELITRLKAASASLDLIESAPSFAATYDANGRVTTISETLADGRTRTTTYSYAADGTLTSDLVTIDGAQWRTDYTYVSGRMTGATRAAL